MNSHRAMVNVWIAAADNNTSVVNEFLTQGGSPNAKDHNGYTPIHAAASYGHLDLLQLLISRGGDVNVQDNEGDTPLHHVEDLKTAIALVKEYKADCTIKNSDGLTAAEFIEEDDEHPEIVKFLKNYGQGIDLETELVNEQLRKEEEERMKPRKRLANDATRHADQFDVKYTMENPEDIPEEILQDKKQQLEQILNSENPEEGLRDFLRQTVRESMLLQEEQSSYKRQRDQ